MKFENPIYVTEPILPDLEEFNKRIQNIWDSKWFSNNGKEHIEFEAKLKKYLRAKNISLFNNGTSALMVGIRSLDLSGEVITTPFTFPATPHVLSWNGITPVFCDIEPDYLNIDADKIEALITPSTTAILGVHVFGNPCDVEKIQKIADKFNMKVIYDGAHAFGAEINNIPISEFGDITMFSFHPTKLFHTAEGGALCYNDDNLKQRIELLKNFGIKNENEVLMIGLNGKMNEIQAAIGNILLDVIDNEKNKRAAVRAKYTELLNNIEGIKIIPANPDLTSCSEQYFIIRILSEEFGKSRDVVYDKLKEYNIFTRKYFYPLCSSYDCYSNLPTATENNLPTAHTIVTEVLTLPFYSSLSISDIERICYILKFIQNS